MIFYTFENTVCVAFYQNGLKMSVGWLKRACVAVGADRRTGAGASVSIVIYLYLRKVEPVRVG